MDNVLQKINNFITLKDDERFKYTQDFTAVFATVIDEVKKQDSVFASLYNGPNLGGSYADNLKVSKPDEFDLVLRLKLRETKHVIVKNAKKRPGFVTINLTDSLKIIENQIHNKSIHDKLKTLVDDNNYLAQDKLQRWIESIFTKALDIHNKKKFTINGRTYNLSLSKAGPAHTITVTCENRTFSIDFVPAIVFDKSKWMAQKQPPESAISDWIAVPKPLKKSNSNNNGNNSPNIYFQTSYVDTERYYITRKNNLKNTLRMIKKIRDKHNIQNLKSYFIKTVFLWESIKQQSTFWDNSPGKILIHMFEKLVEYVQRREMPFFWHPHENMFGNLSDQQMSTMFGQLNNICKKLKRYSTEDPEKLYDIFLTADEINYIKGHNIPNHPIQTKEDVQMLTDPNSSSKCCIS